MADLIKVIESFNRKERFFLIQEASGGTAFRLSDDYRNKLAKAIGFKKIPSDALVAMDYHLDWLHASLFLAYCKSDEESDEDPFCNDTGVSTGNQQDIDLFVAFKSGEVYHLIFIEAKAYGSWDNKQLNRKVKRLCEIFGDGDKYGTKVIPYFVMASPRTPQTMKRPNWPRWMTDNKSIRWLRLCVPTPRRKVTGCDDKGDPLNARPYFKIECVNR